MRTEPLCGEGTARHAPIIPAGGDVRTHCPRGAAQTRASSRSVTSRRVGSTTGCEPAMTSSTRTTWHE